MHINPNDINLITLLLTELGLFFAFFQYLRTKKDQTLHLIKILKKQLDVTGCWVGSGSGYGQELTEEQKYDNANPFKLIYEIDNAPFTQLSTLDGISDVPEEVIGEILQFNQDIMRLRSLQSFRNQIVTSDLSLAFELSTEVRNARCNNVEFNDFRKEYKKLVKKPGDIYDMKFQLLDRLVMYGEVIHCSVIGNPNSGAREHWEKVKKWALLKECEIVKLHWWVYAIVSLAWFLILLTFFSMESARFATKYFDLLSTILTAILIGIIQIKKVWV